MIDPQWIPLIQTLIWILLIIILIIIFWSKLSVILSAIVQRIEAGAAFVIGPVNIGSPPAALRNTDTRAGATAEGLSGTSTSESVKETLENRQYPPGLTEEIYLVHAAQVITPRSERRHGLYRVHVWLEAYDKRLLNDITRVTYRLHHTFQPNIIATESRDNNFELWLNVYGEFTIVAYAERNNKSALWFSRYLELPGRPPD